MGDRQLSIDSFRSEYDGRLLDPVERRHQAMRLYHALIAASLWPSNPRILDVGCGSGFKLLFLGSHVWLRVGCDIRREPYQLASRQVQGVYFVQANGIDLPFRDGFFDLVTCISVIEEFPDYRAAIAEMSRCVAPGGTLCINVVNGVLLKPLYGLMECFGLKILESSWRYTEASVPIVEDNPTAGFHIDRLVGWRHVHLTPYMVRHQIPVLRWLPKSWVDTVTRRFAPTFVHAWQRPDTMKNKR
jgi:ubiquinone/menaquinone biosynthesis C-methylase UbiE